MRRPNYEIVLKALSQGQEIEFEGYKLTLQRTIENKLLLCFECKVYKDRNPVPKIEYHKFPMALDRFMNWCETLPEDLIFTIGANNALNEGRHV